MNDLNTVQLTGRLGGDVETIFAGSETQLSKFKFSLAVSTSIKKADGTYSERINWINCVCWGVVAKTVADLRKGDRVFLSGSIVTGSYDGKNGKVYTTDVNVNFLEKSASMKTEDGPTEHSLSKTNGYQSDKPEDSDVPW